MDDHPLDSQAYDQDPYEGTIRPLVICSTPRSGASVLGELLFTTGQLGVPHEYFHEDTITHLSERWSLDKPVKILRYLQKISRHRTTPNGVLSLKCHFTQLEPLLDKPDIQALLGRCEVFVRIKRRDLVAQAVSFAIAHISRAWTSEHKPKKIPHYDAALIEQAMDRIILQNTQWDKFFNLHNIVPLEVVYEDMIWDPNPICTKIARLMEIDCIQKLNVDQLRLKRQTSTLNAQWIEAFTKQATRIKKPPAPSS